LSLTVRHSRTIPAKVDAVAIAVTEDDLADTLDADDGPGAAYAAGRGFTAKVGQTMAVPGGASSIVFVGLGPASSVDTTAVRRAAAAAVRAASRHGSLAVDLLDRLPEQVDTAGAAAAAAEGVVLGAYRFDAHRSEPSPAALTSVRLVAGSGKGVAAAVARGESIADAVCWARDLVNEPGGTMTPTEVASRVRAMGQRHALKVSVMDESAIRKAAMGGLLGVNRGSEQPPRFVKVSYVPDGRSAGTVALVGKGITFDSGGLSIKTAEGMKTMKDDMGGGAAVLAAMAAVSALRLGVTVHAYVPLTDNMTGGDATRPGDVLVIRGGTTVEVLNTDAEGRLVLADALTLATEDAPDAVIDLATLTGACMVALGKGVAGLMGRNDGWLAQVEAASARTGERVWRLPLPEDMRPQLDSKVADLKNIGTGAHGGALIAGLFLREFVGADLPWAHVDIAGPAWADEANGDSSAGGTGFGVRLLVDLLENFESPSR
jgi:leucyl aminopeptidase